MTLGRTSDNKIKIKTDGDDGLRAVSCGCCGNCLFDAFSPTPTPIEGAQKFKYLTLESTISYSVGQFNPALESWYLECAPAGDEGDFTCGAFGSWQRGESQSLNYKATFRLKSGEFGCDCEVIKATGSQSYFYYENQAGTYDSGWGASGYSVAYNRTFVDADWSTWQNEDGQFFLNEKTSDATWQYSFCENCDSLIRPLTCADLAGSNYLTSEHPYTYSEPLESGGFKVQQRTIVESLEVYSGAGFYHPPISASLPATYRQTLHNTLAEIWGPNQLEMRP